MAHAPVSSVPNPAGGPGRGVRGLRSVRTPMLRRGLGLVDVMLGPWNLRIEHRQFVSSCAGANEGLGALDGSSKNFVKAARPLSFGLLNLSTPLETPSLP